MTEGESVPLYFPGHDVFFLFLNVWKFLVIKDKPKLPIAWRQQKEKADNSKNAQKII